MKKIVFELKSGEELRVVCLLRRSWKSIKGKKIKTPKRETATSRGILKDPKRETAAGIDLETAR